MSSYIICPVHDGRPCVMACISCTYFFVCDNCIESDAHRGHHLMTFDSASTCITERLRKEQDTNSVLQKQLESDLTKCSVISKKERELCDSRKEMIIRRRESLKRHIDSMAKNLVKHLEQGTVDVMDQIDAEKKNIQELIVSANEFHNEVNELLTCNINTKIIAHGRLLLRPDIVRNMFPIIRRPAFQDNNSSEKEVRHLFGKDVMEDVKLSYPSFFNEDGTFVQDGENLLPQHTPEPTREDVPKYPEEANIVYSRDEERKDITGAETTKNETDISSTPSEDLKIDANLPRLPFLETEIGDETEMSRTEADDRDEALVSDSDGSLPFPNMKHYDNFLSFSDEVSQSESTWDGSFSSSVSTQAYDPFDNMPVCLDGKKNQHSVEEEVFPPLETETDRQFVTCNSTEVSSSIKNLTTSQDDNPEASQQDHQGKDSDVIEATLHRDTRSSQMLEEDDVFSPNDSINEQTSYSNDESDTSSFGKVFERGNSFKQNYFESVDFDTNVVEIGDTMSSKPFNELDDIEFEPVQLRPKSKNRDLFPSKEFPIMERKSKEIDGERTKDKLDCNMDDSVLPRTVFDESSSVDHDTITEFRRSAPHTHKYNSVIDSRKMSFLQEDPSARLKLKQSFSIDSPLIIACPTPEGRCWLSSFNRENEIVLVNRRYRVKRTIQFDTLVLGMTMLDSNQLLVCCRDEMCIKQVLQDYQVKTFFSTAPLRPSYICSGFTDEMFVTLTNKTSWSTEQGSISVAIKYSGSTCQEMARAQFDVDAEDLFFFPSRICLNSKCMSLAIINYTSPSMSHLVLLDRHMSLVLRYIDHHKVIPAKESLPELSEKFFITDVRFDPFDNIIIAEQYTKEIQLLDQSCQLLRVLVCEQATPWSLALQSNGFLWVGFDSGSINIYRYKLKFKRTVSLQRSFQSPW